MRERGPGRFWRELSEFGAAEPLSEGGAGLGVKSRTQAEFHVLPPAGRCSSPAEYVQTAVPKEVPFHLKPAAIHQSEVAKPLITSSLPAEVLRLSISEPILKPFHPIS